MPIQEESPEVLNLANQVSQVTIPKDFSGKVQVLNMVGARNISINEKGEEKFVLPGGMERAKGIFLKTEGYRHVKETLDDFGHVLITGAPGCGKTTIAYYIMSKYEQHCDVVFVDDLTRFKFERDINVAVPTLLVLDDVFGHFSLTTNELVRCKQVFTGLNNHFSRLEEKRKKRNNGDKSEMDDTGESTLKVIMTSRTNVMEMIEKRFRNFQHSLLRPSAVTNLTTLTKLTQLEKERILTKHLTKAQRTLKPEIIRSISSQEYKTLGYPHLCQLFVDRRVSEELALKFFREPIRYLVDLLTDVFQNTQESKSRACVLLLMILNDGVLRLTDLQSEGRKRESGLASKISKCREILGEIPESELCRVAKQDISSFLVAEGDVMKFSHPTMHDAVAFVVGDENQMFILENCSLQFIIERTKVVETTTSPSGGDFNTFVINLTKETAIFLVKRLAKEIVDHNFALPLSHSCFSSKDMVDSLFQELSSLSSKEETLHSLDSQYGLGFLFWAAFISEGRVFETALLNSSFDLHEVSEGCLGFCMSGNGVSLGTLLSQFSEDKVEIINKRIGEVFPTSSDTKALYHTISSVPSQTKQETSDEKETLTSRMHGDNQDQLIHIAAANGFPDVVETLIQHGAEIDAKGGNDMTALMYACYLEHVTLVRMLLKQGANPRLLDEEADNCLHLACRSRDGSLDTVKMLYDERMDVNIRGEYERSPLMYAAWNGHEDVVNFLLENGAEAEPDVTSLKNKDNCLHLACIKGHKKVVEILLTKGNMSTDAMGGVSRTPIMYALRHGQLETAKVLREREASLHEVDKFGFNCLHLASMSGDVPTAEWVLKETRIGGDTDKGSCLRLALQRGRIEMTQYWCENGASLSYVDDHNTSCINFASRSGSQELVDMCLDAGLKVNSRNSRDLTPAIEACKFGHVDLLKYLVLKGADVLNPPGCLHVAAKYAHIDVVKHLVDNFPNIGISTPGFNGWTPLLNACAGGDVEVAACLKSLGASPVERDTWGLTCLHTACHNRHIGMVLWLLRQQEVDVNSVDENGKTSLMIATKADSPEGIDILVKAGADINHDDKGGWTSLHVAAYHGKTQACSALLERGANVNAKDNRSRSPLHSAAINPSDQCSVAGMLIAKDATVDARDDQYKTPAMYAISKHNVCVLEFLLSNGADVNTVDDRGRRGTLLHYACSLGQQELDVNSVDKNDKTCLMITTIADSPEVIDILVKAGADVNQDDKDGRTSLHVAAYHGRTQACSALLERGANVNAKDNRSRSPLHSAAINPSDQCSVAGMLIAKDATVDARDDQYKTPAMYAISKHNVCVLEFLLSNGADVNTVDDRGRRGTLLHYACSLPDMKPSVVDCLIEYGQIQADKEDRYGQTPLMAASRQVNNEVVDCLLEYGANPRLADSRGRTCSSYARERGHNYLAIHVDKLYVDGELVPFNGNNNDDNENITDFDTTQHSQQPLFDPIRGGTRWGQRGTYRGHRGGPWSGYRGHWGEQRGGHWGEQRGGQRGDQRGGHWGEQRGGHWGDQRGGHWGDQRGGHWGEQRGGHWGEQRGGQRGDQRGGQRGGHWGEQRGGHWGEQRGGHWGEQRGGQRGDQRGGHWGVQRGGHWSGHRGHWVEQRGGQWCGPWRGHWGGDNRGGLRSDNRGAHRGETRGGNRGRQIQTPPSVEKPPSERGRAQMFPLSCENL